jgi:hypothetical protein
MAWACGSVHAYKYTLRPSKISLAEVLFRIKTDNPLSSSLLFLFLRTPCKNLAILIAGTPSLDVW